MTTMQTKDHTSETDVPTGQGFRYPPQVFTDPTYTEITPQTEEEEEKWHRKVNSWAGIVNFVIDVANPIAGVILPIGKKRMLDIERSKFNPSIEKTPSPTTRKPPTGWATYRHKIIKEVEQARPPSLAEEPSTDSSISK